MTPLKRALVLIATSCATATFLAGCSGEVSVGKKTVSQSDVEKQAETQLASQLEEPDVTCSDDLDAKVDATLECTVVTQDSTDERPVTITVTSVKDGKVKFDIDVPPVTDPEAEGDDEGAAPTVAQADVEQQAATQLAAEVNQPEPEVTCPGDLVGEVGATLDCTLVAQGETATYPVTITVTAVEDGKVKFDIEVGAAPVE